MAAFATTLSGLRGRYFGIATISPSFWSGFWGLADQALISLTNFVTMVLLARRLGAAEFGAFVLVYSALLFAGNLQTSLITRPHNVFGSELEGTAFASYTASTAVSQVAFALAVVSASLLGAGVAYALGSALVPLLLALAFAAFAWQAQEFFRQVQYTKGRAAEAFSYDLISYGGQLVAIIMLLRVHALNAEDALLALGATSLLSAAWGLWRCRKLLGRFDRIHLKRNWGFGRWLLAEALGQWLSIQALPVLTAAIAGTSATGLLKAVQMLVAPVHIVMNAFVAFTVPRAARAYTQGGKRALLAFLLPASIVATVPLVAYWLAIGFAGTRLLSLLYPEGYGATPLLVWLMSLSYFVLHLQHIEAVALMALGDSRSIFTGRIVAILLTFSFGLWLIERYGAEGALIGSVISGVGLNVVLAWLLYRSGTNSAAGGDAAAISRGEAA